ncbi:hypothetical protein [Saccharolobus sp. A20]|uniref:hypothetical protein n=1 Tax=Saccharolobus sp. A20 TaxID=1891280 RepID=UPI001E392E4F|nr:hypothetical protein [Sulfolobus sp. A20]
MLALIISGVFLVYLGLKSNSIVFIPQRASIGSYFAETKYVTTFYINRSILFNNDTVINTNSMFSALTEKLVINGYFNTTANYYQGNYTANLTIKTPYWSKLLGTIGKGNLTSHFLSYSPNFTYYNNLVKEINNQLKIQGISYIVILNISVYANLKYPYGEEPIYVRDGIVIENSSFNISVLNYNDSTVSGSFYREILIKATSGYNYTYFYGAFFLILFGISAFFIVTPDAMKIINRNSIRGPPHRLI